MAKILEYIYYKIPLVQIKDHFKEAIYDYEELEIKNGFIVTSSLPF